MPAGRLDIDSIGLLVLTQDGRVARQLIGEDSGMEKEYFLRVTYTGSNQLDPQQSQLVRMDDDDPVSTNALHPSSGTDWFRRQSGNQAG